ncbi:hypothetical protein KI387_024698, partial [Taxus chinensis]
KDHSRLTLAEIQTLELANIPEGASDNESVLDPSYDGLNEDQYVFPPIDWSVSEKASVTDRSTLIITRTKAWIASWGMSYKDDNFSKLVTAEAGTSKKGKDKRYSKGPIKVKFVKKRREREISSIVSPVET